MISRRDRDPSFRQEVLEAVQREMWDLRDLRENEASVRIEVHVRLPPNLAGAGLPVSRTRFDHFTTIDGAISRWAIDLQLSPQAIAAATRVRRSMEKGLAMRAGLLPPEHILIQKPTDLGIPRFKLRPKVL